MPVRWLNYQLKMAKSLFMKRLDETHVQVLLALMRGESAAELIREQYLMPSVVTDAINEALFDEIGDNVLECDGDEITLVEDYREELTLILNGEG